VSLRFDKLWSTLTLRNALGKDLGHSIELRHDALLALRDGHRVMELSILGVVTVCFVAGLELIIAEDAIDDGLFLLRGLARGMCACGGLREAGHVNVVLNIGEIRDAHAARDSKDGRTQQ
jgi:hypothetical protein